MFLRPHSMLLAAIASSAIAAPAFAQPIDPPAAEPPTADAPPTAEEQALADALAADAAAEAAARPPPAPAASASAAALLPDIAFIVDVAGAWFSDDAHLQAGGHDPTKNGFNLQQVEMSIGKAVDPYFRLDGNIVFGLEEVEVEEAYATAVALPHSLQVRAGQFLTRFGRFNSTHVHTWDFLDQPFALSRLFGGEANRGVGVEVSWLTPLPWYTELVASATDPSGEGTARSFLGDSDETLDTPLDVQSTVALKQFFELSPDWSLLGGVSLASGPNPTGPDKRTNIAGVDLYVKWRPITEASTQIVALQSEWMMRRRQVPGGVLADVSGYAQLFWRFARRWGVAGRYEFGSAPDEAGDDLDPEWTDDRQRFSGALTFWPSEFSRIRAQGSYDLPGWRDGIWAAFLALEVSVGAHGAHKF